jgi:hypothetical protein
MESPDASAVPGANISLQGIASVCQQVCGVSECEVQLAAGEPEKSSLFCPQVANCRDGTGRRPHDFVPRHADRTRGDIGEHFAQVAHLEAESVGAFRILRDDLAAHGAPARLVRAAGRAARDEIRHARATNALARRYGVSAEARPRKAQRPARSLELIALENAVEGCVRETYGALVATWQAREASDPEVRAAMKRIARDETRHAELSWEIAKWARGRLDTRARTRVDAAMRDAARGLAVDARAPTPASVARAIGAPPPDVATALVEALAQDLWEAS